MQKSGKENKLCLNKGDGTSNMKRDKTEYQQSIEGRRRIKRVLRPIDGNSGDFERGQQGKKPRTNSRESDLMPIEDADELEQIAEESQMQDSTSNDEIRNDSDEIVSISNEETGNDSDEEEQVIERNQVEEVQVTERNQVQMQVENQCMETNMNKQAVIVYVSKLMENNPQPDDEDDDECDFDEIAVAIETSHDVPFAILLKLKEQKDVNLKLEKYYLLENASSFNLKCGTTDNVRCILIGPETRVHLMSARMANQRNPGLTGQLKDLQQDADAQLEKLPTSMKLDNFPYGVKETINLLKGESVFYVKAFVLSSQPQPRKKNFPGTLMKVIDDKSGRFLNVLIPEQFQSGIGHLPNAEDTILLKKFITHKSQKFATSMVVATKHSRIEISTNDRSFWHLKGYSIDISPPDFEVLSAGYAQNYEACPKKKCFLKKVKYVGDGQYECPKCYGKYLKDALKIGRQLLLTIESEDVAELKVSVFNKDIDDLMKKLNCQEVCDLPEILVDLHIQPNHISPGRNNLPDVLKKIEVLS